MPSAKPKIFGEIKDWKRWGQGGDEFTDYAVKGEWAPVWYKPDEKESTEISNTSTPGGFTGVDYGYFTDLFKKVIESGDPNLGKYRQLMTGQINKSTDLASQRAKENLAQSGLLRGGANLGVQAGIDAGRSNALGQAEGQLAEMDTAFRSNAIQKLLGLQSLGLQELGGQREYSLGLKGLLERRRQFDEEMGYRKDQEDDWLGGLLGGVGGTLLGSLTGGIGTGVGSSIGSWLGKKIG